MSTVDYDREQLRSALLQIAAQHPEGAIYPAAVVEAAREPSHILHRHFEWDDGSAGEAFRIIQARSLIRRVQLVIVRTNEETREVSLQVTRQYQSRPSMRSAKGGYEPVDAILSDDDKRRELLAQVLSELNAYRRRYSQLSELQRVWTAVDEALDDHGSSAVGAPDAAEPRHGAAGA
jgi:hypothetical protein